MLLKLDQSFAIQNPSNLPTDFLATKYDIYLIDLSRLFLSCRVGLFLETPQASKGFYVVLSSWTQGHSHAN